jgi:hypothetical protein
MGSCQKPPQLTDRLGGDVGQVLDGEDPLSGGIQCRQHVQSLAPTGGLHKQSLEAPERSEKRRLDKVRGVHKEDQPVARFGFR